MLYTRAESSLAPASSSTQSPNDQLISRWPFNTNLTDSVGDNSASAPLGSAEFGTFAGKNAVVLDGDDAIRVSRSEHDELSLVGQDASPFTITFWVYFDEQTGSRPFNSGGTASHTIYHNDTGVRINGRPAENGVRVRCRISPYPPDDTNPYSMNDGQGPVVPPNEWHHFAFVVDPSDSLRIYLDGELSFEDTAMDGYNNPSSEVWSDITIGSWYGGNPEEWVNLLQGNLSEVRVYGTALSNSQISRIAEGTAEATFSVEIVDKVGTDQFDHTEPAVGDRLAFDASDSFAASGSIQSYEWDFDGDGTFEQSGSRVERVFGSVGRHDVTLRITDADGDTATTTQTIDVGLAGETPKLEAATLIDDHSTVDSVEGLSNLIGVDLSDTPGPGPRDFDMTDDTIKSIRSAVNEGSIDPETAAEAVQRLRAVEGGSLQAIYQLGPEGPYGYNAARQFAQTLIGGAFTLIFIALGSGIIIGLGILGPSVGTGLGLATGAGLILTGVSTILSATIGNDFDESSSDPATAAMNRCKREANGILQQMVDGTLSTVDEILVAIDDAVEQLVDGLAEFIRFNVDFTGFSVFQEPELAGTRQDVGLGIYPGLKLTNYELKGSKLTDGLEGSTAEVIERIGALRSELTATVDGATSNIESINSISAEASLLGTLADALQGDESAAVNFAGFVGGIINLFRDSVIGVISAATNTALSAGLLVYLSEVQTTMVDLALTGEGSIDVA